MYARELACAGILNSVHHRMLEMTRGFEEKLAGKGDMGEWGCHCHQGVEESATPGQRAS